MKTAGQRKMVDSVLHKPIFIPYIQDLSSLRFGDQTKTNSAHVHSVWLGSSSATSHNHGS